jgi:hypothetical protein
MEESKTSYNCESSYICEYDPSIPIVTDAEPFIILNDTEIPTMSQIHEYQTLLKNNIIKDKIINELFEEKITREKVINDQKKEIEALKNTDTNKMLAEYEKTIYDILPTMNKAFIHSNVSGLGNDDVKQLREKRIRKKDIEAQKTVLYTMTMLRCYFNQCVSYELSLTQPPQSYISQLGQTSVRVM